MREETVLEAPAPLSRPPVRAPGFRNPVAFRVGWITACLAVLLSSLPVLNLFFIVWSGLAGFLAVYLYRRRTGHSLTVGHGASLGWVTGVFTVLIMAVLLGFSLLLLALSPSGIVETIEQQLGQMGIQESVAEVVRHPIIVIV